MIEQPVLLRGEQMDLTNRSIPLGEVNVDLDIYPRSEWKAATVDQYAEALAAGEVFPPIILEVGTNRLLDGLHRLKAHQKIDAVAIEVEWHAIPDGIPAKLYAASLSTRHGDRIPMEDRRVLAREIVETNAEFNQATIARCCGVTRQTVSKWTKDIADYRILVRQVAAFVLNRCGWSGRQIGDLLGISEAQVRNDVNADITAHLTEELLAAAASLFPEKPSRLEETLNGIREEKIFAAWSLEERDLLNHLRSGETTVVNQHRHVNLINWATSAGLFIRIDRQSRWGNPFEMGEDGDRATVIANYRDHHLPYKYGLHRRLDELKGKALGCWCAPEACHGDVLAIEAGDKEPEDDGL